MTVRVMLGFDMGTDNTDDAFLLAGVNVPVGAGSVLDYNITASVVLHTSTQYFSAAWGSSAESRFDLTPLGEASGDTFWGGFWYRFETTTGDSPQYQFGIHRGGSDYASFLNMVDSDYGVFYLYWHGELSSRFQVRDSTGADVGDSFQLLKDHWYWISFEVSAVGAGTLTFKVDGKPVVNAVAGDYAGAIATGGIYSLCLSRNQSSNVQYFEDWVFGDGAGTSNTGIPEGARIDTIFPDGDSSNTGFTTLLPTTPVDRYSKINENPTIDDDTSYIDSAAVSDEYTVTLGAMNFTPESILAIKLTQRAEQSSGVDVTTLRNRIFSGASYYNGTDLVLVSVTYANVWDYWELDPATAAAWTESNVNALLASGILV